MGKAFIKEIYEEKEIVDIMRMKKVIKVSMLVKLDNEDYELEKIFEFKNEWENAKNNGYFNYE